MGNGGLAVAAVACDGAVAVYQARLEGLLLRKRFGLGVKFGGHEAKPFRSRKIEGRARDAQAFFGLAADVFGVKNGGIRLSGHKGCVIF